MSTGEYIAIIGVVAIWGAFNRLAISALEKKIDKLASKLSSQARE